MVNELFKEVTDLNYTYIYLTMLILIYYVAGLFAYFIKTAINQTKSEIGDHPSVKQWSVVYQLFAGTTILSKAMFVALLAFYLVKFYGFI